MISINTKLTTENSIGKQSVDLSGTNWNSYHNKIAVKYSQLGYLRILDSNLNKYIEIERIVTNWQENNIDTVVILGIGGSDLGGRTIAHAFPSKQFKLIFSGDTTDPDQIYSTFSTLDFSRTAVVVISKSGNTIEPASVYAYLMTKPVAQYVFITDDSSGILRELADNQNIQTLTIPDDVGGRFSVLTPVGLIVAAICDLDLPQILAGGQDLITDYAVGLEIDKIKHSHDLYKLPYSNPALLYAAIVFEYYNSGRNVNVIMPYSYRLKIFGDWYRQLIAESLGKAVNKDQNPVHIGITPVSSLGPVDQHSQLQLYNEGPQDKLITFIDVVKPDSDLKIPTKSQLPESYHYFADKKFRDLLYKELATTRYALTQNQRPSITISVPELNEYYLGQLFVFFELVVSYFGELANIDVYNQPGVELSKNAMYAWLGKPDSDSNLSKQIRKFEMDFLG